VALVAEPDVMYQILQIEELHALLWLKVDERCALVRAQHVPQLQALLEQRGIAASATLNSWLRAPKKPKPPVAPPCYLPAHRHVQLKTGRRSPTPQVAPRPAEEDVELERGLTGQQQTKLLQNAIENTHCVVLDYQGKVRRAIRKVAPLALEDEGSNRYLHAYDFWRADYRWFRLDRIEGLAVVEDEFDPDLYS
jgi:hypothetical protein